MKYWNFHQDSPWSTILELYENENIYWLLFDNVPFRESRWNVTVYTCVSREKQFTIVDLNTPIANLFHSGGNIRYSKYAQGGATLCIVPNLAATIRNAK